MSTKLRSQDLIEERRQHAQAIGERVRRARRERRMTQTDVAGNRFSKAYISAIERGRAFPSMPSLQFIADQLALPPEWFLSEADAGEPTSLPSRIRRAWFSEGRVFVELGDGRAVGMPMARSRKLWSARTEQLDGWTIVDAGRAISWPELGEEIGLEDFLGLRLLRPSEVARAARPSARRAPLPADAAVLGRPMESRRIRRTRGGPGYSALAVWLRGQEGDEIPSTFVAVEQVLGRRLPDSVRRYSGPWYSIENPLGRAIRGAGWRASVKRAAEEVTFRRIG